MLSKLHSRRVSRTRRDLQDVHSLVDDLVPVGLNLALLDVLELVSAVQHPDQSVCARCTEGCTYDAMIASCGFLRF